MPDPLRHRCRGSSIAEALVAAALAGVVLAAVALVARLAGASLQLARETSTAVALAEARIEALRAGPREDGGDDVTAGGVTFTRTWTLTGGRGRATRIAVDVGWRTHRVAMDAAVYP